MTSASTRDLVSSTAAARCGGRIRSSICALVMHAQAAGAWRPLMSASPENAPAVAVVEPLPSAAPAFFPSLEALPAGAVAG